MLFVLLYMFYSLENHYNLTLILILCIVKCYSHKFRLLLLIDCRLLLRNVKVDIGIFDKPSITYLGIYFQRTINITISETDDNGIDNGSVTRMQYLWPQYRLCY